MDAKTEKFLEQTCIFCQPWWLEAVSPRQWDIAVVRRGDEVAAVLPYAYRRRPGGFLLLEMPPLTPYLGPWLRRSDAKYANRLSEEKKLISDLIDLLPKFAVFNQAMHPTVTNWLPFYWRGYNQTTRYSYIINAPLTIEKCWGEIRENIRTDVRKSQKVVEVRESATPEEFLNLLESTYHRQGKTPPHSEGTIRRLVKACNEKGACKILLAIDAEGRAHAGIFLVWDSGTVYNLMSGGDPELRNSGATSLLMWHAIEFALSQGKNFDFEGSMVEAIERFFRAFGARQVPYFSVSKMNSKIVQAYRASWKFFHPKRKKAR